MSIGRRDLLKLAGLGSAAIRQFASLFPNNARPVQGRNRRFLIESN